MAVSDGFTVHLETLSNVTGELTAVAARVREVLVSYRLKTTLAPGVLGETDGGLAAVQAQNHLTFVAQAHLGKVADWLDQLADRIARQRTGYQRFDEHAEGGYRSLADGSSS